MQQTQREAGRDTTPSRAATSEPKRSLWLNRCGRRCD
uniref:Uncharacterized protein n=1 Tax=Arundo donax TaxID=35708 RepID=A0A0A9DW12_ARUDO